MNGSKTYKLDQLFLILHMMIVPVGVLSSIGMYATLPKTSLVEV